MHQNSKTPDYQIEEYKALRAEMIRHMDSLDRNIISTITATGVAIAYGLKESPFVLLLAIIIPIYFWIQHVNNRRKLAKISSYIAVFLEGDNNLMWHRRNHIQMGSNTSPLRFYLRTFLLPYPVLLIVSILVLLWYFRKGYLSAWPIWVLIVLSGVVIAIVGLIAHRTDRAFWEMIGRWSVTFEGIKQHENLDRRE